MAVMRRIARENRVRIARAAPHAAALSTDSIRKTQRIFCEMMRRDHDLGPDRKSAVTSGGAFLAEQTWARLWLAADVSLHGIGLGEF
jgi:hypothetical protein